MYIVRTQRWGEGGGQAIAYKHVQGGRGGLAFEYVHIFKGQAQTYHFRKMEVIFQKITIHLHTLSPIFMANSVGVA